MSSYPKTLWGVPAHLPFLQPILTEETLRAKEAEIGFKLPLEYVQHLRVQNGGNIRWRLPDQVHNVIRGIGSNYPSLEVCDWESYGDWLPFDSTDARKMVLFDGDGHWMLCLDYRENDRIPSVTLVDTEAISEEQIAGSFAGYLELLEPDVDGRSFALFHLDDLDAFKQQLESGLRMNVDPPYDTGRGCLEHRLIRKGDQHPLCIWICANEVADTLTSGLVKCYPGLPDNALIMTVSEEIIPEVLNAVAKIGVEVRPLAECHGLT